jgi:hypothetical protein
MPYFAIDDVLNMTFACPYGRETFPAVALAVKHQIGQAAKDFRSLPGTFRVMIWHTFNLFRSTLTPGIPGYHKHTE